MFTPTLLLRGHKNRGELHSPRAEYLVRSVAFSLVYLLLVRVQESTTINYPAMQHMV